MDYKGRAGPSSAPCVIGDLEDELAKCSTAPIQNPKSKIQNALRVALCVSAVNLCSCQTERVTTSDGWPLPPPPHAAPKTPASAKADRMVFTVGSKPNDSNNNGFPDTIRASVALFSSKHPIAMRQNGAFIFELYPQGTTGSPSSKPIASWRIESDGPEPQLTNTFAGPSYLFNLSLLDTERDGASGSGGGDQLPLDRADMICRFEPADGSPHVTSDGVRTIQIGRRLAVSGPVG